MSLIVTRIDAAPAQGRGREGAVITLDSLPRLRHVMSRPVVTLLLTVVIPLAVTLAMVPLRSSWSSANIVLVLAAVEVLAAISGNVVASGAAIISAAVSYDLFFTRPYARLSILSADDIRMVCLLALVGLVTVIRVRFMRSSLEARTRQLASREAELIAANKNLEAFAYSVAHDLRTPLRGISGFAEALADDYGDRLDDTGREYAARVQAGCARMATLIDDLLHLSQVTRAKMNLQDVDLSAEVTAICDQLRARDPGRQVKVTVQEGARATADRALIRSALDNLLDNAWKFTARRDGAAIEFATTPAGDAPICCYVRDNGAGFDPVYAGKLFQPFQRLHDAGEFPGTGIGLASVRRIIERHGGRTWAEGAVDGGATIYFTLGATGTHE